MYPQCEAENLCCPYHDMSLMEWVSYLVPLLAYVPVHYLNTFPDQLDHLYKSSCAVKRLMEFYMQVVSLQHIEVH